MHHRVFRRARLVRSPRLLAPYVLCTVDLAKSNRVVLRMAKLKMRKGVRVVLKNTKVRGIPADGVIIEAAGGHCWNVRWSAGPHAREVNKQSSVYLMFWTTFFTGATDAVASAALKPMLGKLV